MGKLVLGPQASSYSLPRNIIGDLHHEETGLLRNGGRSPLFSFKKQPQKGNAKKDTASCWDGVGAEKKEALSQEDWPLVKGKGNKSQSASLVALPFSGSQPRNGPGPAFCPSVAWYLCSARFLAPRKVG